MSHTCTRSLGGQSSVAHAWGRSQSPCLSGTHTNRDDGSRSGVCRAWGWCWANALPPGPVTQGKAARAPDGAPGSPSTRAGHSGTLIGTARGPLPFLCAPAGRATPEGPGSRGTASATTSAQGRQCGSPADPTMEDGCPWVQEGRPHFGVRSRLGGGQSSASSVSVFCGHHVTASKPQGPVHVTVP